MSTLTSHFSTSVKPGRHVSLLALAPALPRSVELRRSETAPGGPRRVPEGPLPHLEHIDPDPHFIRTFLMLVGGIVCTIFLFLSLPFTQKISERGFDRAVAINIDRSRPPPPPPVETRPREEPKPQESMKPELVQEVPKLSLTQLEAAINPGTGGVGVADLSLNFGELAAEDLSRIFELTDLDRHPVPIVRTVPDYPFALRNGGVEGHVTMRFVVTSTGTVTQVKVVSSTRYEFEKPAVAALERWRFEPGVRHGTRVAVRMEQRIDFSLAQER